jgi:hypothetical protein
VLANYELEQSSWDYICVPGLTSEVDMLVIVVVKVTVIRVPGGRLRSFSNDVSAAE